MRLAPPTYEVFCTPNYVKATNDVLIVRDLAAHYAACLYEIRKEKMYSR